MATTKVTFTLDPETVARLSAAAARLAIPKSAVVREAIRDFSDRAGQLGEAERRRLLDSFDRLVPAIPRRSSVMWRGSSLSCGALAARAGVFTGLRGRGAR